MTIVRLIVIKYFNQLTALIHTQPLSKIKLVGKENCISFEDVFIECILN